MEFVLRSTPVSELACLNQRVKFTHGLLFVHSSGTLSVAFVIIWPCFKLHACFSRLVCGVDLFQN